MWEVLPLKNCVEPPQYIEGDRLRGSLNRGLTVVTLLPKEGLLSEQGYTSIHKPLIL